MRRLKKILRRDADTAKTSVPTPSHKQYQQQEQGNSSYEIMNEIYTQDQTQMANELDDLARMLKEKPNVKDLAELGPVLLSHAKYRSLQGPEANAAALSPQDFEALKCKYAPTPETPPSGRKFVRKEVSFGLYHNAGSRFSISPTKGGFRERRKPLRPATQSCISPVATSYATATPPIPLEMQMRMKMSQQEEHPRTQNNLEGRRSKSKEAQGRRPKAAKTPERLLRNPKHSVVLNPSSRFSLAQDFPKRSHQATSAAAIRRSGPQKRQRQARTTNNVRKCSWMLRRKAERLDRLLYSTQNENAGAGGKAVPTHTKNRMLLEDYKHHRFRRTLNLLSDIDVTNPKVINPLYQYKLEEQLRFEEDLYRIQDHVKEMLADPTRPVARIEKQKLLLKRLTQKGYRARSFARRTTPTT